MDMYLYNETRSHLQNVEEKINELREKPSDEVDWNALNALARKRDELLGKLKVMEMREEHDKRQQDMVNHPKHYERENAIECIDEMEMVFGPEELMVYCKIACWKYRYRAADKGGAEDISKSDWYMHKYKELKDKVDAWHNSDSPHMITTTTSYFGGECECQ